MKCECANSVFIDAHHKHVITGNLEIIQNNRLRLLFTKGPNYRENRGLNWKKASVCIKEGLTELIEIWSAKEKKDPDLFENWKNKVLEHIDNQIKSCQKRYPFKDNTKPVLCDKDALEELEALKEKICNCSS